MRKGGRGRTWRIRWGVIRAEIPAIAPEMPGRVRSFCACLSVRLPPSSVIYTALGTRRVPLIQTQVDLNDPSGAGRQEQRCRAHLELGMGWAVMAAGAPCRSRFAWWLVQGIGVRRLRWENGHPPAPGCCRGPDIANPEGASGLHLLVGDPYGVSPGNPQRWLHRCPPHPPSLGDPMVGVAGCDGSMPSSLPPRRPLAAPLRSFPSLT